MEVNLPSMILAERQPFGIKSSSFVLSSIKRNSTSFKELHSISIDAPSTLIFVDTELVFDVCEANEHVECAQEAAAGTFCLLVSALMG